MKITKTKIDDIRTYENNPRNNDEAVEAVAKSLQEFGWRQPIVVDGEGVIIVGHTRCKSSSLDWPRSVNPPFTPVFASPCPLWRPEVLTGLAG